MTNFHVSSFKVCAPTNHMPKGDDVSSMFGRIAGRYDRANRLLSGGTDLYWRRHLVRMVSKTAPSHLIDLATGSGDVAFALQKGIHPSPSIIGLDFCQPMLDQAVAKQQPVSPEKPVEFLQGDILNLPFENNSFDTATIAFGFRNLENRDQGLSEIFRILKPSGNLFILEFSQPYKWFRPLYFFYLKRILPRLAKWATGDIQAYQYLAGSIESFPSRQQITQQLQNAGFSNVRAKPLTLSIVAIHHATKP